MKGAQPEARTTFRMPEDVKTFLASEAKRNFTSQNAEIIRAIRERMDRTNNTAPESVGALARA